MKRLIILMTFLMLPLAMSAQISSFFERYSRHEGYQSIVYGKRMMDMMKDNASADVKSLLDRISSIRIISCDRPEDHIVATARRDADNDRYEIISQINEGTNKSYFYILEKGRKSNFLMIVSGAQGSAVIEIVGEFDVKDISKLSIIGQKK